MSQPRLLDRVRDAIHAWHDQLRTGPQTTKAVHGVQLRDGFFNVIRQ